MALAIKCILKILYGKDLLWMMFSLVVDVLESVSRGIYLHILKLGPRIWRALETESRCTELVGVEAEPGLCLA